MSATRATKSLAACLLLACTDASASAPQPLATAEGEATGSLSLHLGGFRSAEGQALIAVYRGEDGFPGDPGRAWKKFAMKIAGDRVSVDLPGVPVGEYAAVVVHDENGNNDLDTNWLGIPREGVGASNNAKGRMGPPRWRDARFTVTAAGAVQRITLTYL